MKYIFALCLLFSGCSLEQSTPKLRSQHGQFGTLAAAISFDARLSLTSSDAEHIVLWDINRQEPIYRWQQLEEDNAVLSLALSADNSFALAGNNHKVALFNLDTGDTAQLWEFNRTRIRDLAVSNQAGVVAIALDDNSVVLLNPDKNTRTSFHKHQSKLNSLDISADGKYVLSGSNDYVAYYWNSETLEVKFRFVHSSRITQVNMHPTLPLAITVDARKQGKIWDLNTGKLISELASQETDFIMEARFSKDGRQLLTSAANRDLSLWSVASGYQLHSWKVPPKERSKPPSALVYSAGFLDSSTVVSESSNGYAEYWSIPCAKN